MIVPVLCFGWLAGYLLTLASDYLPRFASSPTATKPLSPPVIWQHFAQQGNWTYMQLSVEVLTAFIWGYMWIERPDNLLSLFVAYHFFMLITLIDLKYRLILNIITYPAIILILAIHLLRHEADLNMALGGVFAFSIFFLASALKPGTLGGGDIKLATAIGFMLGFPYILWALLITTCAGGIGGIYLFLRSSDHPSRVYIPYAPFLAAGAVIALLYNPLIGITT